MPDIDAETRRKAFEEWPAALRSGKYRQGEKALNKGEKFCCLGVYADLCEVEWEEGLAGRLVFRGSAGKCWAGALPGDWVSERVLDTLIPMNDWGKDFAEIADYIEENLVWDEDENRVVRKS
jgi:hypothetical protein